jgi:hypothetical protein
MSQLRGFLAAFTAVLFLILVLSLVAEAKAPPATEKIDACYYKAVRLYGEHKYDQALEYFSMAATGSASKPVISYYMGLCNQNLHRYSLAKQQFEYAATWGNANIQIRGKKAADALTNFIRPRLARMTPVKAFKRTVTQAKASNAYADSNPYSKIYADQNGAEYEYIGNGQYRDLIFGQVFYKDGSTNKIRPASFSFR